LHLSLTFNIDASVEVCQTPKLGFLTEASGVASWGTRLGAQALGRINKYFLQSSKNYFMQKFRPKYA